MRTSISKGTFKNKKLLAILIAFLLAISLHVMPLSDAAQAFALEGDTTDEYGFLATDGDSLGFESSAVAIDEYGVLSTANSQSVNRATYDVQATLPAKWDIRETNNANHNQLTPVRNQNPFGVCWTFGFGQALESATVRAGLSPTQSFSASNWISSIQLANAVYNKQTFWKLEAAPELNPRLLLAPMTGSNFESVVAALSKWYGAVPEDYAAWPFSATTGNFVFYVYLTGADYEGEYYSGIEPKVVWKNGFDPERDITESVIGNIGELEKLLRNAIWSKSGTYETSVINNEFKSMNASGASQVPYTQMVAAGQPILGQTESLSDSLLSKAIFLDYYVGMTEYAADENLDLADLVGSLYVPSVTLPEIASESTYHVQDATLYPANYFDEEKTIYQAKNTDVIKQAVYDNGTLQLSYAGTATNDASPYYNATYDAQYVSDPKQIDHSVAIVGWDDTFAASKFNAPKPPGNGAYICKNSWGTSFGDGGYFYLSYYDKSIGSIASFDVEPADNYDSVVYLDDIGASFAYEYASGEAYMANVFSAPAHNPVTIEAVGIQTHVPDQYYEVRVYANVQQGAAPTTGTLSATWTGKATYAGYYTYEAPANQIAKVNAGTHYAIVVKVINGSKSGTSKTTLPTEGVLHNVADEDQTGFNFHVSAGESYISRDGKMWQDVMKMPNRITIGYAASDEMAYSMEKGNFCIKAYTSYAAAEPVAFPDVAKNAWYYSYVSYVAGHGLMLGYADSGNFGPDHTTTRGQVATVLYRLEGSPSVSESSGFPDVADGMFYSDPVSWAKRAGIVTGYSDTGNFRPDREITREEMAAMLARYAELRGVDIAVEDIDSALSGMQDSADISNWARPFVAWCAQKGIMTGKELGGGVRLADPAASLTRGELAKMLTVFHRDMVPSL